MITKYKVDTETAMKDFDLPGEYKKQIKKKLEEFKMANRTSKTIAKDVKKAEELSLNREKNLKDFDTKEEWIREGEIKGKIEAVINLVLATKMPVDEAMKILKIDTSIRQCQRNQKTEIKRETGNICKKRKGEGYQGNDLKDEEWEKIKDYIKKENGRAGQDDRKFLNGVFWILKANAPWRDLPPDYGKWYTVHKRFLRWVKNGKWERLAKILSENTELKDIGTMIDSYRIK